MPKSKCLNIVKVLLTLSNVVVYDLFIYNESYWQFFSVFFCNRLLEYSFEQFAEPPPLLRYGALGTCNANAPLDLHKDNCHEYSASNL